MTPKRHHACVPAVEGETNLLLVSVCMIRPEIDSPVPAITIASVRGIRLIKPMNRSSPLPVRKPARLKSCTPVMMESTVRTSSETNSNPRRIAGLFHLNVLTKIRNRKAKTPCHFQ